VTFAKSATEVINDTIDPEEQPLIMKALPARSSPKSGTSSATKPKANPSLQIKRAIPVEKGKKKLNGQ
jgi:hypothetical protein